MVWALSIEDWTCQLTCIEALLISLTRFSSLPRISLGCAWNGHQSNWRCWNNFDLVWFSAGFPFTFIHSFVRHHHHHYQRQRLHGRQLQFLRQWSALVVRHKSRFHDFSIGPTCERLIPISNFPIHLILLKRITFFLSKILMASRPFHHFRTGDCQLPSLSSILIAHVLFNEKIKHCTFCRFNTLILFKHYLFTALVGRADEENFQLLFSSSLLFLSLSLFPYSVDCDFHCDRKVKSRELRFWYRKGKVIILLIFSSAALR